MLHKGTLTFHTHPRNPTSEETPLEGREGVSDPQVDLKPEVGDPLEEIRTATRSRQLVKMVPSGRIRILVLLLLPFGAYSKLDADEGTSCTSSQGWDGLCMLSYECAELGQLVVKGYTPELCNTAGPVICCPSGPSDDVPAARPGVPTTTFRPVNISPSPTPYVAEESHPRIRKVSIPQMRIRRRRPAVKRHAHILLKTYNDDDDDGGVNVLIRARRPKPSRRRKRRPVGSHVRNPGYSTLARKALKPGFSDHGISTPDYGYSNSDHGFSTPEYGYSQSDHGFSNSDHGFSNSDHGYSNSDHGFSNAELGFSTPSYGLSTASYSGFSTPSYLPDHYDQGQQVSLVAQIAEAKLEADQEAALLLADMSIAQSVTVDPSRAPPSKGHKAAPTTPRMSRIMCDAYNEAMMETVAELSKKGVVSKKTERCTLNGMMHNTKSAGALVGEFPHVVGLGYSDQSMKTVWGKCSGALISEHFILTAAHCTHAPAGRPISIGMGSRTLASESEIGIKEIIVHPLYNKTTYANDLALLRLAKKTRLSDTLRPACLQTSTVTPRSLVSSHWSSLPPVTLEIKTRSNETRLFSNPDVMGLQKEKMTLLKNKDCDINTDLNDGFICAQSAVHRRNDDEECQGYGGDALQYRNAANRCMHTLVGIAVENVCDESPIAFTKVAHYLNWIESIVWA